MRCSANHLALSPVNLIPGPSNSNAFQNEILVFCVQPKEPSSFNLFIPLLPLYAREDAKRKKKIKKINKERNESNPVPS